MKQLVYSLKRLFGSGQVAKAKIDELHKKGILTDEAVEFILTSDEKEEPVE